jgi:riboflavin kinase / FMN adenylyltransferase
MPAMLVVKGYADVPEAARHAVLAVGNFDGVHRGHQALIARAKACAAVAPVGAAGVIIFDPHPRALFQPNISHFQLTPHAEKLRLLERYGADVTVVLAFDHELAALSAQAFVEDVLVRALAVRHVIVGYDFHFGKARGGSPETLVAAGQTFGFGCTVIEPIAAAGVAISSTAVRGALAAGQVDAAAQLLGRWWSVSGVVTGGAKRGTGMGYPTANITLPPGITLGHGIYAVRVHVGDHVHDGAAYLGTRPTFDNGAPVLETFLLDFDGDLYGQSITIAFVSHLRGGAKFDGMPALIAQMDRDVAEARMRLAAAPA